MRLAEWVSEEGHGAIQRLAESTGLHYTTVHYAVRKRARSVRAARLLSAATDGAVSAAEILGVAEHTDNVAAEPAAGEGQHVEG
jgi:hypothetical protein